MEMVKKLNEISLVRKYDILKTSEIIEYITLVLLGIAIPLFLQGPQLLVGAVVNFALIITAINVKGMKKILPLIFLPSIAALSGGILFGDFTPALLYMLPFIWLGNALLVFNLKDRHVKNKDKYLPSLFFAVATKVFAISSGALILTIFGLVPVKFLLAMGILQLVTALLGGFSVIPVNLIYKKIASK